MMATNTAADSAAIIDALAESLRVDRHGLVRPLWADMPASSKAGYLEWAERLLEVMQRRGITVARLPVEEPR